MLAISKNIGHRHGKFRNDDIVRILAAGRLKGQPGRITGMVIDLAASTTKIRVEGDTWIAFIHPGDIEPFTQPTPPSTFAKGDEVEVNSPEHPYHGWVGAVNGVIDYAGLTLYHVGDYGFTAGQLRLKRSARAASSALTDEMRKELNEFKESASAMAVKDGRPTPARRCNRNA